MTAPPHRVIPGDQHQQYWQDGGQKPPGNPFYIPFPPHGILPGFETHRLPRVSTRSLISNNQQNNGISLGGTFLSENCERGRSGVVDKQAVFNQGSDRFQLHRESSFQSGDPNPAVVSWRSFEFEQDRFLMESREWRFGRGVELWDRRERSFHDPSVQPLAFETASLAAEPPSLNSSRGLCSAGSVCSLGGDASTAFEHGLPPMLLPSSGLYFYGGEVAEGTDIIENSHVIGSGPCPQWVKPMCSRTSTARDVPSDQVFHRRQPFGHRTVNKSDPIYISTEDSIRWTYNTQRKTPNIRSMVDDHGCGDDGSMNKRGKTKVCSDRNANFYSRCAEQPIQKPSAFSRIQSSLSVWERLEKKPLSPCSSPSAFSSPRNSNENQAEVDTLDLPFKSDALVAEVLDPLTAEPSLIAKDISVVKTKRVVKKKKKRRKNEVIPIVPGLLESSKHQVIPKASCLSSRTNDSLQSEIPVKAVTSCCLLGESSLSGCCTEKVKKLAVVSRNEAKEAIETVIQLEGCITGMPVVEDEPKFKDDTDNVKAKNYNDDVVLWSETIEDSNLQLCQQGQMMQMTVSNDVNAQNITKKFSQVQDLATEIVDDSVEKGLMVAQKLCYNYEHPVIFEALTSSNVCPQSSDPFLPLRELNCQLMMLHMNAV
ncbi:hypothetical protein HPP92_004773 [Vanilla planifolia]|uniref:Uncharacterized protein n=1 Tax=Vanilla planifolia TaxID=51239 RepID=A0A835RFJ7_VANPL|nr:hypothetical protein HPP92_004773 [Vanilla planifolia]